MGFLEVMRTMGDAAVLYTRHKELVQLLSADRASGMNYIERTVQHLSPQELDQFESDFLDMSTTTVTDPAHRRRAMELYAWMKMAESHQYGKFRGFIGNG
jgi:hypothetical protein